MTYIRVMKKEHVNQAKYKTERSAGKAVIVEILSKTNKTGVPTFHLHSQNLRPYGFEANIIVHAVKQWLTAGADTRAWASAPPSESAWGGSGPHLQSYVEPEAQNEDLQCSDF